MTKPKRYALSLLAVAGLGALLILPSSCSSVPRRDPTGETFPSVSGTALEGDEYLIPDQFRGEKVLLLVGYVQDAQFDIDRWLLGLMQAEVDVKVYEVPTIRGKFPGMIAGTIDDGMRRGIPSEDWGSVVTVYGDADKVVQMTGNENPNNGRVLLLDEEGRIIWFWDQGYSARRLLELEEVLEQ